MSILSCDLKAVKTEWLVRVARTIGSTVCGALLQEGGQTCYPLEHQDEAIEKSKR